MMPTLLRRDVEQGKATDKRWVLGDEIDSRRLVVGGDAIDDEARAIGRGRCIESFVSGSFPKVGPSMNDFGQ